MEIRPQRCINPLLPKYPSSDIRWGAKGVYKAGTALFFFNFVKGGGGMAQPHPDHRIFLP